jgi:hypothetical protein
MMSLLAKIDQNTRVCFGPRPEGDCQNRWNRTSRVQRFSVSFREIRLLVPWGVRIGGLWRGLTWRRWLGFVYLLPYMFDM